MAFAVLEFCGTELVLRGKHPPPPPVAIGLIEENVSQIKKNVHTKIQGFVVAHGIVNNH